MHRCVETQARCIDALLCGSKLSGGVWQAWVESFVGEDHGGTVVAASAVRA
jgi:hypothetical protein